jgi:hypothetical protein
MHEHKDMRLVTRHQFPGDAPRQTFVVMDVEHDHGAHADSEDHDHVIGLTIEVDGKPVFLTRP